MATIQIARWLVNTFYFHSKEKKKLAINYACCIITVFALYIYMLNDTHTDITECTTNATSLMLTNVNLLNENLKNTSRLHFSSFK